MQSGLEKLYNFKSNSEWLESQFKNTFLSKKTSLLLKIITFQEILLGIMSISCIVIIVLILLNVLSFNIAVFYFFNFTFLFAPLLLFQLFFGQRIAKDYVGAGGIVPYIIYSTLGLIFVILFQFRDI